MPAYIALATNLVLSIIWIIAAIALLKLIEWGRKLTLVVIWINIITVVISTFYVYNINVTVFWGILGLFWSIIFTRYLVKKEIKAVFK